MKVPPKIPIGRLLSISVVIIVASFVYFVKRQADFIWSEIVPQHAAWHHSRSPEPITITLGNLGSRSRWKIPKKYLIREANFHGEAQDFIQMSVSLNKLMLVSEKDGGSRNVDLAEIENKADVLEIMLMPGLAGGVNKTFKSIEEDDKLTIVAPDVYGLVAFHPTTPSDVGSSTIYFRPLDENRYPDTFFQSLSGLTSDNPWEEHSVIFGTVRIHILYSMARIEEWRTIDEVVRAFVTQLLVGIE